MTKDGSEPNVAQNCNICKQHWLFRKNDLDLLFRKLLLIIIYYLGKQDVNT